MVQAMEGGSHLNIILNMERVVKYQNMIPD
jgi:hypothetical protein